MILRFLPYLGMVLTVVVIVVLAWLTYRYVTRHDRLAPRRELQKQILDHLREEREVDKLLEELVTDAKASNDTEPVLAHSVISKISGFKSQQNNRKELFK